MCRSHLPQRLQGRSRSLSRTARNLGVEPRPQTDAAACNIADLPMEELPNT